MTQRPISIFKALQALSPKGSIMPDSPNPQLYYCYNQTTQTWNPVQADTAPEPTTTTTINTSTTPLKTFTLTTWNIDFQQRCKAERTRAGLNYLSKALLRPNDDKTNDVTPINIIFLQEMVPNDLTIIQQTKWIQDNFFITDLNHTQWRSSYGTTTLIDKRCHVQRVFRVPYSTSRMQRDGLFVDLDCQQGGGTGSEIGTLRLCNTHLESLLSNPPIRPMQLYLASQFMHGSGPGETDLPTPHAAILAGDLNAFAPEDLTAPNECGLHDAFLVLGGKDGTEESFTWGQQIPDWLREKFGCSRMDKVLFCGGLEVDRLERIGAGEMVWIEYPDMSDEETEDEKGEEMWITDHLGLSAEFRITGLGGRVD
ncbi:endonuclease/exonuclease/phosphatase family protein [Aspergillus arachidicola]|uniref:Endonuclease/exonuclease/phosphatase family protein n=1 Tax=Aspergillus arachidicola TaxID=656916 RepID=A0A2G7FLX9_9EURO|nr:endonuclease/exonuclease/phosphatase family protein [Aspergillus arachidicola]